MTKTHFGEAEEVNWLLYWLKPMFHNLFMFHRGYIYRQIKETYDTGFRKHHYYYLKKVELWKQK